MAIEFGAISAVSTSQTPTSVAVSGSDTLGIVFVAGDATDNITAVTWGGVSMTKINAVFNTGDRFLSAWWIANPSSSATISFTGGSFWRSFSMYYTGCAQTGQPDSNNVGTANTATVISVATTVVASGCWLVMGQKDSSGGKTYTASNGLASMRANADAGGLAIADSNGAVATGSVTGTLTATGNTNHAAIAFSIAPAASTTVKTYLGTTTANVKTVLNGTAIANRKTWNGIA